MYQRVFAITQASKDKCETREYVSAWVRFPRHIFKFQWESITIFLTTSSKLILYRQSASSQVCRQACYIPSESYHMYRGFYSCECWFSPYRQYEISFEVFVQGHYLLGFITSRCSFGCRWFRYNEKDSPKHTTCSSSFNLWSCYTYGYSLWTRGVCG